MRTGFNYLRKVDTFGVPIDLCFEKKKMHKTPWGGFWTMMIFLFSLSVFIILGLEIVYHQKPNVISIEQLERGSSNDNHNGMSQTNENNQRDDSQLKNKSRATYSSSGIILALAGLDNKFNMIENIQEYIVITGYMVDQKGFQVFKQDKIITFQPCSNINLFDNEDNKKLYNDFNLNYLMCMSNYEQLDQYQTGEFGSEIYSHIQIVISYKENIDQTIKDKLAYIGLFITDQMMDVQNYSEPLTKYRKNIVQKISKNKKYEIVIRNQHAQIKTDSGLIWEDYTSENFFYLKDYKVNIDDDDNIINDNILLTISTETDPKLLIYNHSFYIIQ